MFDGIFLFFTAVVCWLLVGISSKNHETPTWRSVTSIRWLCDYFRSHRWLGFDTSNELWSYTVPRSLTSPLFVCDVWHMFMTPFVKAASETSIRDLFGDSPNGTQKWVQKVHSWVHWRGQFWRTWWLIFCPNISASHPLNPPTGWSWIQNVWQLLWCFLVLMWFFLKELDMNNGSL